MGCTFTIPIADVVAQQSARGPPAAATTTAVSNAEGVADTPIIISYPIANWGPQDDGRATAALRIFAMLSSAGYNVHLNIPKPDGGDNQGAVGMASQGVTLTFRPTATPASSSAQGVTLTPARLPAVATATPSTCPIQGVNVSTPVTPEPPHQATPTAHQQATGAAASEAPGFTTYTNPTYPTAFPGGADDSVASGSMGGLASPRAAITGPVVATPSITPGQGAAATSSGPAAPPPRRSLSAALSGASSVNAPAPAAAQPVPAAPAAAGGNPAADETSDEEISEDGSSEAENFQDANPEVENPVAPAPAAPAAVAPAAPAPVNPDDNLRAYNNLLQLYRIRYDSGSPAHTPERLLARHLVDTRFAGSSIADRIDCVAEWLVADYAHTDKDARLRVVFGALRQQAMAAGHPGRAEFGTVRVENMRQALRYALHPLRGQAFPTVP